MKYPVSPFSIAQRPRPAGLGNAGFTGGRPRMGWLLAACVGLLAVQMPAQSSYTFATFAGVSGHPGGIDGTGGSATSPLFNNPTGLAVRSDGSIFVSDTGNYLIRLISPAGVVTTLAGQVGTYGSIDGTGTAATFNSSQGGVVDSSGNYYVAEYASGIIRKVTSTGVVTTFAGTAGALAANDGTGTAARFNRPSGLAIDGSGNIYVADSANNLIRKITSAGVVTTLAGNASGAGSIDGTGNLALFSDPRSVAVDGSGNVFVADTLNNTIRKITSAGVVTTLAGSPATFGRTDGIGSAARFSYPNALVCDGAGNLYVADTINNSIRKIVIATATVSTLVGALDGTPGYVDGAGNAARFDEPAGLSIDTAGNIYVADYNNSLIRKITPAGVVTTIAGTLGTRGAQNGTGYLVSAPYFSGPTNAATDASGNIYVADAGNNLIRKITPAGVVTTLAGAAAAIGHANGVGSAASFDVPSGVAVDAAGNVYVADTLSQLIRVVSPAGAVTTLAGTANTAGSADGPAASATFNEPSAVAVDAAGNVYVADYGNHTIRMVSPAGLVTTVAGTAGVMGKTDGLGAGARFNFPRGLALDPAGNLYVADTGNHAIRRISPGGLVVTLAGTSGTAGSADGAGNVASFNGPSGLAVDASGTVFVVDTNGSTIRRVTAAGVVSTIGGVAGAAGNVDGIGAAARFDHPVGLAVDAWGNLFIADTRNDVIRIGFVPGTGGVPPGPVGTTWNTGSGSGSGSGSGTGGRATDTTGISTATATGGAGFVLRPAGIFADASSNIWVADTANNCIKKIIPDGTVTVFAGNSGQAGSTDGTGTAALFNGPTGLVMDASSNIYVSDTGNSTIRMITPAGVVTTLAGSPGARGSADGTGSAARFSSPIGITYDPQQTCLYVADSVNNTIRQVTTAGVVTTIAGAPLSIGDADGPVASARFNNPTGITVASGTSDIYIADTYNHTIRMIPSISTEHDTSTTTTDPTTNVPTTTTSATFTYAVGNQVTTLAGSAGLSGAYDGINNYALFNQPTGIYIDSNKNIYVTDTGNSCIRYINSNGYVGTVAGVAGIAGSRDGPSLTALFNQPQGLTFVGSSVIVADTGNSLVRRVSGSVVATLILQLPTTTTSGSTGSGGTSTGSGGGGIDGGFAIGLLVLLAFAVRLPRGAARP